MTNKEIANRFNQLGKIMDLHGENKFKTRSYYAAYETLRKYPHALSEMSLDEIVQIDGVGKAISEKIVELNETGELKTYLKYENVTPQGIIELLDIKGIGPKKVRQVWKELGVEDAEELLEAIEENKLLALSGFGQKTQDKIKDQLIYHIEHRGKHLLADVLDHALDLKQELESNISDAQFTLVGDVGRQLNVVDGIDILTDATPDQVKELLSLDDQNQVKYDHITATIHFVDKAHFGSASIALTSSEEFLEAIGKEVEAADESEYWKALNMNGVPPFFRESEAAIEMARKGALPKFIEQNDVRGIIHNHSTYSDGIHTLREMSEYVRSSGFEYFVISDHSKAAFYANGLDEKRVEAQWAEIDELNKEWNDFRLFKGIECDILSDGKMDFEDDFLKEFEVVVASIHAPLSMDEKKATNRLIKAIENPHVHILGHMTGRKQTVRKGYPVDHMKVIDACAANGVSIEINANPFRLDIDWTWIPYCMEKGVLIGINPDAHSTDAVHNIRYGVLSAQKGGLTAEHCLNSFTADEFDTWLKNR